MTEAERAALLCTAVAGRHRAAFTYRTGGTRVVEPHLLGTDARGHLRLSAWLVRGASALGDGPGWRDYYVGAMRDVAVLDETCAHARPGYNRFDQTMAQVRCRV